MPHAFDTGATVAQRTRVRNAVIAKLAPLLKTANPARYIPANGIKPLPRILDGGSKEGDEGDVAMLEAFFNGASPAIGVALGRLPLEPGGMEPTSLRGSLPISVYVGSQHGRDLVAGRLAADVVATANLTADPGLETILEHVLELLAGQDPGVAGVGELRAQLEDPSVAVFADWTIGEVRFSAELERDIKPWRGVAQLVTEVENRLSEDSIPDETAGLDPFVTTVATLEED